MPDCFGEPVVTYSCAFLFCMRGCGCIGHPAFPAPSVVSEGHIDEQLGQIMPRECASMPTPSFPAQARSACRWGRAVRRGPGIHNHDQGVWIPGSTLARRPGMTLEKLRATMRPKLLSHSAEYFTACQGPPERPRN